MDRHPKKVFWLAFAVKLMIVASFEDLWDRHNSERTSALSMMAATVYLPSNVTVLIQWRLHFFENFGLIKFKYGCHCPIVD